MRTFRRLLPGSAALPTWGVLAGEAVLVVAATGATGALMRLLPADDALSPQFTPLLPMATAGIAALAALICVVLSRLREDEHPFGTVAAAWVFYALCVMPLRVVHDSTAGTTVQAGAFAAALAFLVLLALALTGPRHRWLTGTRGLGLAVAFTALVVAVTPLFPAPASVALDSAVPDIAVGCGWLLLACGYTLRGHHRHDPFYWRVGFGLGVVAAAHLNSFAVAAPGAPFDALRLLGLVVLAVGVGVYARRTYRRYRAGRADDAERAATVAHAYARRDHEMRNALANLAALPTLVNAGVTDPDMPGREEMAGMLVAELSRLSNLLDERPAPPHDDTAPVDLVLGRLATLRRTGGRDITLDCRSGLVAAIPPATLVQVVTNLLANCDRYAPGAPVRITAEHRELGCVIDVSDSGPGPTTDLDGAPLGSGLGLALTSQLLARHGGTLELLPAGETGCTARVQLPRAHVSPLRLLRPRPEPVDQVAS